VCAQNIRVIGVNVNHTGTSGTDANNNFQVERAQLEIGEHATAFETTDASTNFARCQRYFQVHAGLNIRGYASTGFTRVENMVSLPVTMRASPTSSITVTGNSTNVKSGVSTYSGFRLGTTPGNAILSVESAGAGITHISNRTETLSAEF